MNSLNQSIMVRFVQALLLLIFTSGDLFAQEQKDNIYLIESINGKASAKNPSLAKNIAINNARRDAFMVLLLRLQLPIATADNITNDEIAEMVRSEQIIDEKIAGNNYSASFNIIFAKNFVDHILTKKTKEKDLDVDNQPSKEVVESKLERYLIFPVKMVKKQPLLWEAENDWRLVFERSIAKNKLQNVFVIPEMNSNNISIINSQNVNNPSFSKVEKLLGAENYAGVYFLNFYFDEIENKVLIEVFYLRKLFTKQFRLSFINIDRLSYNDLIAKVSEKVLDYLRNNPIGGDDNLNKNMMKFNILVKNFDNWLDVKQLIEASNLIDEVEIVSMSKDNIRLNVNYINTRIPIEEGFGKLGLDLVKKDTRSYEINAISQ